MKMIQGRQRPTAVSLFSGCGGSDAGLVRAGYQVLMANDILGYAKDVYEANHPDTDFVLGDVADIRSFPQCDLLAGCYPCQGFSQGGAREADRTINYLYKEFGRALRQCRPKAFIVENVSGMIREDFRHLLTRQLKNFRHAGYNVSWDVLNAADYGVAQERRRILIVGIRKEYGLTFTFPRPTHGPDADFPYVTIRKALKGLPDWPDKSEYNTEPFHWYYMSRNRRRGWDEVSKTIVSRARHMPLHPISPTLEYKGPDRYAFSTKGKARRFSYREAACLQGFGSKFKFPDTHGMHSKYKVIGNAVPPQLFYAIASALPEL